jgi:hypothetical protein
MAATITIHHFQDNEVIPLFGRIGHVAITVDLGNGQPPRTFEVNVWSAAELQSYYSTFTIPPTLGEGAVVPPPLPGGYIGIMDPDVLQERLPQTTSVTITIPPASEQALQALYNSYTELINASELGRIPVDYSAFPHLFGSGNCSSFVYENFIEPLGIDITQHMSYRDLQQTEAGRQFFNLFLRDEYHDLMVDNSTAGNIHVFNTVLSLLAEQERLTGEAIISREIIDQVAEVIRSVPSRPDFLATNELRMAAALQYVAPMVGTPAHILRRQFINCFSSETLVRLANGAEVPICEIRVGDLVAAFEGAGELRPRRVARLLPGVTTEWIELDDGTRVTPGHRYLRPDGSFGPIADILAHDGVVVDADGLPRRVAGRLIRAISALMRSGFQRSRSCGATRSLKRALSSVGAPSTSRWRAFIHMLPVDVASTTTDARGKATSLMAWMSTQ